MELTKAVLKCLNRELEEIQERNERSNEMGALIDFGEWSQSAPEYGNFMEKYNLAENDIMKAWQIAETNAVLFYKHFPKRDVYTWGFTPEDCNPWQYISRNFADVLYYLDRQKEYKPSHFLKYH